MKKQHKKLIAGVMGGVLLFGCISSSGSFIYGDSNRRINENKEILEAIAKHNKGKMKIKSQLEESSKIMKRARMIEDAQEINSILKRIDNEQKPYDKKYDNVNEFEKKLGSIIEGGSYAIQIGGYLFFLEIDPNMEILEAIAKHNKGKIEIKSQLEESSEIMKRVRIIEDAQEINSILKRIDNEQKPYDKKYDNVNEFEKKLGSIIEGGSYAIQIGRYLFFLEIDE